MKQKIPKKGIIIVIIMIILCTSFVVYYNSNKAKNKILANVERKKVTDMEEIEGKIEDEHIEPKDQMVNEKSEELLNYLQISLNENETVKVMQQNGKRFKRLTKDNYEMDFDDAGNISRIFIHQNFEGEDVYKDRESIQPIIDELQEVFDIEQYQLVECHNQLMGSWNLVWNNVLDNGIVNPLDVVVVTLNAKNGEVMCYNRNERIPDCDITIMESEKAVKFAKESVSAIKDEKEEKTELTVVNPNFYWEEGGPYQQPDFVRIAWKISYENGAYVWIDAETGECLGGDSGATFDF